MVFGQKIIDTEKYYMRHNNAWRVLITVTPLEDLALPLSEPDPLPAHAVVRRLAPLTLGYYRYLDAKEI